MDIVLEKSHDITPKNLAAALANAEPSEFAAFWLHFAQEVSDEALDSFAEVMAPSQGSLRKQPLWKLCALMEYHTEAGKRGPNPKRFE